MKHTTLLLVMLCLSFSLLANNNESAKDLAHLVRLLPDRVTPGIVKEMFGEAAVITINNKSGEQTWQYANENSLMIRWDMKKDELKYLSFNSRNISKQNWSNEYLSRLEMGRATLKQVVDVLGYPKDLSFSSGETRLKYAYADNNVELQFKNGVLSNVHISLIVKKKVDDVTITVY